MEESRDLLSQERTRVLHLSQAINFLSSLGGLLIEPSTNSILFLVLRARVISSNHV
ncbi:hypothetical protein Fmac_006081 [Flemingia macrophylla]|uniref:Uncharacterized protein n=1 Tax=Flemingia macrophylla TaxID=520843 RepID=A0ABD1N9L0_9FABA